MKQIYIGEAMKNRRLELRLSQDEVCEGICEVMTLSRLENGRQTPTHNRIKALMQRLNMPDDRYYALLNTQELELDNSRREFLSRFNRFERASEDQKHSLWELAVEQLRKMESLAAKDDTITQQFILSNKALLGREDGPYSLEERLKMQLAALRLTVPKFDLENIGSHRYSLDETQLLNQIAVTYSTSGEHIRATQLYGQLYEYANKSTDRLSAYARNLTLVAHNYSRELAIQKYYDKAIEIAEHGKRVGVNYGYYQFLPGLLYITGECYYRLGEAEESKERCLEAHYLYKVLEDERNLRLLDSDMKKWFDMDFWDSHF